MKLKASFITLTFLCFFAFSSYTNIVVAQSVQNVVWTSVVNCTVNGNSLQKTSGCNNCADAGAVSRQTITSGDGYVEFIASEQTTGRMIGLSNGNPGTTATEISYGILLSTSTRASAQEHAVYKDETGYVAGDVFRIAVVGGVVKYSKNGVVFYTSAVAPTYPLLVDTSLHTLNATINNVVISSSSTASNDPELPRVFIDTTYPTTGTTINVDAAPYNGNLQAALDAATPGTTINLTPGATYTGNFVLRNKNNPQNLWIIIRSASTAFNSNGSIPPNTRVNGLNSAHTNQMARIRTQQTNQSAITVEDSAHHYRLVGLDVGAAPTVTQLVNMITPSDTSYTSRSTMTNNIVIDRCYVHGNDIGNFRRGVAVNGNYWSIIDSYISNFHDSGSDSQALLVARGDGPFKIVNNYLEAASENLNFGGSTPPIVGLVPSDIEVRRNLLSKPLAWKNDNDGIPNHHVKNLLESKSMRRALIDGNIFENNWDETFSGDYSGQDGTAILLKSTGKSFPEEALCTWCVTEHVTFTNNIVRHAGGVLTISGAEGGAVLHVNHIKIENLLAYDIGTSSWGTNGTTYGIYHGASDVQIIHTTTESTWRILQTEGENNPNFTLRDNILEREPYGILSWCGSEGTPALGCFYPYTYKKNVIVNNSDLPTSKYPDQVVSDATIRSMYPLPYPENSFAAAQTYVAHHWEGVGFVDRANGNYRLASTSPYKNKASDGKDIGADQDAIEAAINGSSGSVQNVVWTSVVNCTVNGNSLQKTSGCNNCADAGAVSQQTITSGDGYVEFTASERTTGRMIGLSNGNPGTTATEISYGILLSTSTRASAQEHAVYKDETGYVPGDVFRIAVVGGAVKYSKNGVVFYTSTVAPTYPLLVDTSLHTLNATLNNVVIKTN